MSANCQYCGLIHETQCKLIRAIEYHPDGFSVRRMEFFGPNFVQIPGPLSFEAYERIKRMLNETLPGGAIVIDIGKAGDALITPNAIDADAIAEIKTAWAVFVKHGIKINAAGMV